jgi:hypothetical protein
MRYNMALQSAFYFVFNFFHPAELNILDLSAGNTYEMVVVAGVVAIKIIQFAIRVENFNNYLSLRQVFKVPVDSRKTDTFKACLHLLPYLLGAQISRSFC